MPEGGTEMKDPAIIAPYHTSIPHPGKLSALSSRMIGLRSRSRLEIREVVLSDPKIDAPSFAICTSQALK